MKKILFVNDDADTTAIMKVGLNRDGFEVDTFVDSKLALQNFKAGVYDLLLLNVLMKGINGFELYDKMRKIDKNIQICFISASNTFYEKYVGVLRLSACLGSLLNLVMPSCGEMYCHRCKQS